MQNSAYCSSANSRLRKPFLYLLMVWAAATSVAAQDHGKPSAEGAIAFVHVNVIPMNREVILEDQTVVIAGDKIASIKPSAKAAIPASAQTIDAHGKYLLPGLT